MIWPSLVCRRSSNLRSGWEYPREDVKREEWWAECGKPKYKRQKEEESSKKTKVTSGEGGGEWRASTMVNKSRWQSSTKRHAQQG